MDADRVEADAESAGDRFAVATGSNEHRDLEFPRGEQVDQIGREGRVSLGEDAVTLARNGECAENRIECRTAVVKRNDEAFDAADLETGGRRVRCERSMARKRFMYYNVYRSSQKNRLCSNLLA